MKLMIIGASCGIGSQLLKFALEEGHEITALLRKPDKVHISNSNLRKIKGDILDPSSFVSFTSGQDAVCVCVGMPPTLKPVGLFSKSIMNVLSAIGKNPEMKLIVITGIGAGDSRGHGGFL